MESPTDSPNSARAFGQRTGPWGFLVAWQDRSGGDIEILVANEGKGEAGSV